MAKVWSSALICIAALHYGVFAWPEGSPYKMCISRYPKHHYQDQQFTEPPYEITVSQDTYSPLADIKVTIQSLSVGGELVPFTGFQINARRTTGDTEECVGEWMLADTTNPQDVRLQYWYPERPDIFNCVTHRDKKPKTKIELLWRASASATYGDVVFMAGMVKDFDTFWADVSSRMVRPADADAGQLTTQETTGVLVTHDAISAEFTTNGCGVSKGCLLYPPHCTNTKCDYAVTYKASQSLDYIKFELYGIVPVDNYLALGLSLDKIMAEDETLNCFSSEYFSGVQRGYNPKFAHHDQHRAYDISNVLVSRQDGRLFCSFHRPIVAHLTRIFESHKEHYVNTTHVNIVSNLSSKHHLQLAWGPVFKGSTMLKKHSSLPLMTPEPISVFHAELVYATALPPYIKIHAILAFAAWITLSGCGMIISRHGRQLLKQPILGAALWFQLHRSLMFIVLLLTAVFVVIVFAVVGRWTRVASDHAIVGLVTTGLACVQAVLGILRPALDSPNRPLFNWVHRSAAVITQILAITTMLIGSQVSLINPRLSRMLSIILWTSVAAQLTIELILEALQMWTLQKAWYPNGPATNDNQFGVETKKMTSPPTDSLSKRILFIFFFILAVAELVIFIVVICLF